MEFGAGFWNKNVKQREMIKSGLFGSDILFENVLTGQWPWKVLELC